MFIRSGRQRRPRRRVQSSPFGSGGVLDAVVSSVRIDASVDPIKAGEALRRAAAEKLDTYTLPVFGDEINGNAILRLDDGSEVILDYFRGSVGPSSTGTGPRTTGTHARTTSSQCPIRRPNRCTDSAPKSFCPDDAARVCRTVRG